MSASEEAPAVKSPLEKPLSQLTEEDLAQITREECRQFLKNRGMRRPSWNKSQAIQQVISLKALLEDRSASDDLSSAARICRSPLSPPLPPPLSHPYASLPSPTKNAIGSEPLPAKDPSPYRRRDAIPTAFIATEKPRFPPEIQSPLLRAVDFPAAAAAATGQLTIFYDGKVNVYDGVPSGKAREILQIAATPDRVEPSCGLLQNHIHPVYTGPSTSAAFPNASAGKLQRSFTEGRASREPVPEGPTNRKASLKRYLDKKKDRYKGRQIIGGSSSSSIELMHLTQKFIEEAQNEQSKFIEEAQNEQSSWRYMSSAVHFEPPCPPLSRSSLIGARKLGILVDLNVDGANDDI